MSRPSRIVTVTLKDSPPALPAHVVTLLLSYLSPLEGPLPPHLLSEPLRQRHHFLGLGQSFESAEDAAAYLSWPSGSGGNVDTAQIAEPLANLPSPDNFDPLVKYPTGYSCDGETIYAHAQVSVNSSARDGADGLRLVFRWEGRQGEGVVQGHDGLSTNADGWKFHDAKPMPFPPGIHDSPQVALDSVTMHSAQPAPAGRDAPKSRADISVPKQETESDDEDDYWNSYGQTSSDGEEERQRDARIQTSNSADEDAYWARYSSVHGEYQRNLSTDQCSY